MVLSDFYNHVHTMQAAAEGEKIVENTPRYKGKPKFSVEDRVISTDKSRFKIFPEDNAIITDVQQTCDGYFWYTVTMRTPKGKNKKKLAIYSDIFKKAFNPNEIQKI